MQPLLQSVEHFYEKKGRIREAQKHTDPMDGDPDPEHWFWEPFIVSVKYSMGSGPSYQSSGFGSFIIL